MGYRSEVALILKKSDYEELMSLAQPLKEKDQLGFLKNDPKSNMTMKNTFVFMMTGLNGITIIKR